MNCLASTGTDALLPFLIGAILLFVGIVCAAIAARRKRAGVALAIALLLGLGAGTGVLLGAPAPAQAACVADPGIGGSGDPGQQGGGLSPCVPATAIDDVSGTAGAEWIAGEPAGSTDLPLTTGSASAWQSSLDAISALGTPTFANGSVTGSDGVNSESQVISSSGFTGTGGELPANAVYVRTVDFDAATQGLHDPTVVTSFDLRYPDGCGGTLTTHFTASGSFTDVAPPPPPPTCVPATRVPDFAVGSQGVWSALSGGVLEGVELTTAETATWNANFAAIHAIDANPTTVDDTFRVNGNPAGSPSTWAFTGAGGTPPNTVTIPANTYDGQALGVTDGGTGVESFGLTYGDGCGNTLETDVTVTGQILPTIG